MKNNKLNKLKKAKLRKKKIKRLILVVAIFITIININLIKHSKIKNVESKEQIEQEKEKETISSEKVITEQKQEINNEIIVEKNEDTKIAIEEAESSKVKQIINTYIEEKELNSTNFAFFYYNLETKENYFYNEYTYFTAASTIKVPLAMVYYDKINNGDLTLDSTLQYKTEDYEAGAGDTTIKYNTDDYIPLSFLLEQMIVNSDNTATNILKKGLGGEKAYRILIKQYTKEDLIASFNTDNVTSAKYSYDVLQRLYENQDKYSQLIELMKKSSGGGYLKKNIQNCEIAHKYGSFENYVHDYGIVYSKPQYLIGIFTKDVTDAENLIADINKSIYENN